MACKKGGCALRLAKFTLSRCQLLQCSIHPLLRFYGGCGCGSSLLVEIQSKIEALRSLRSERHPFVPKLPDEGKMLFLALCCSGTRSRIFICVSATASGSVLHASRRLCAEGGGGGLCSLSSRCVRLDGARHSRGRIGSCKHVVLAVSPLLFVDASGDDRHSC